MPDFWGLAAIAAKFALYLGVLGAAGTVMAALLFRLQRYRDLVILFAGLGLIASVAGFLLRATALTGDASGMTDPEMLGLLWGTSVGTALTFRVAGLGLVILGMLAGRPGLWLSLLGGLLGLWSFNHIGHIPGRDSPMLEAGLMVHLLALALWIGILTPLRRLAAAPANLDTAVRVGHRFGILASVSVPLLLVAGGMMGYALVGSVSALTGTNYGQVLILKGLLVAALLALAAANKLRFVPAMQRGNTAAAGSLARSIQIEWMLVAGILGTTAVLTSSLSVPT